nr:hypothetical protein [Tanacetum cinerariifolium]
LACGLCNENIELEVATREDFSRDFIVSKGATFTVIPDDNGDFTMDADKHYEMSALSDAHGWEPCEVTGVWLEIVELDD